MKKLVVVITGCLIFLLPLQGRAEEPFEPLAGEYLAMASSLHFQECAAEYEVSLPGWTEASVLSDDALTLISGGFLETDNQKDRIYLNSKIILWDEPDKTESSYIEVSIGNGNTAYNTLSISRK